MNFNMIANSEEDNQILENFVNEDKVILFREIKDCSFHIESEKGDFIGGIVCKYLFDTMQINSIYIKKEYRNNGFGSELFQYIENLAKLKGIKRIIVKTYNFQKDNFFVKKGFKEFFNMNPCFDQYSRHYLIKEYK